MAVKSKEKDNPANSLTYASMKPEELEKLMDSLTAKEKAALLYNWEFWAREKQLPPPDFEFIWLLLMGRGWGKALSIDTPIMTVNGFKSMGDIKVGDVVFDEEGQPANVVFTTDVMHNHPCFEVVFSDGSKIIADAEHLWLTHTHNSRKSFARAENPSVLAGIRTTEDIRDSLYCDSKCSLNHSIECCKPLRFPRRKLPVNPYTLGAWLGDGSSAWAEITCVDEEIVNWIQADGYQIKPRKINPEKAMCYGLGGLNSGLNKLNVKKNKHIPEIYLTASIEQRMALLQGLMDTGGYIEPNGNCEFCSMKKELTDGVFHLCCSLGIKPVISTGRATIDGRDCGLKYRVNFTPYIPVFRLQRKLDRIKQKGKQAIRQARRYIVDVVSVESTPVKCIQVDSPSHLYLAGNTLIPTHNTRVGSEMVRKWAEEGHTPIALIGQTKADVRDTMIEVGDSSILKVSPPWFMPSYEPSKRRLTWTNGVQAIIYSGDEPDQLRGPQHARFWFDEPAKCQFPQETFDNLMFGLRIGDKPKGIMTTTPRPIPLILDLIKDPHVVVTTGHTLENQANLAPEFIDYVMGKYQGTKLGRQELAGEVLESSEGLVYDAFRPDMCIIPRFAIAKDWPKYFTMDFGRVNTAALWYAMEPATGFLYCYRAYKRKASLVEHAGKFRELSIGEIMRRRVGGNLQEQNTRDGYTQAGWPLLEPKLSNDRWERIRRVNSLHSQSRIYYFSDLSDVIDEKLSFSYEVDKNDLVIDKIHAESEYHYMSAEGYLLSEFQPDIVKTGEAEPVWYY